MPPRVDTNALTDLLHEIDWENEAQVADSSPLSGARLKNSPRSRASGCMEAVSGVPGMVYEAEAANSTRSDLSATTDTSQRTDERTREELNRSWTLIVTQHQSSSGKADNPPAAEKSSSSPRPSLGSRNNAPSSSSSFTGDQLRHQGTLSTLEAPSSPKFVSKQRSDTLSSFAENDNVPSCSSSFTGDELRHQGTLSTLEAPSSPKYVSKQRSGTLSNLAENDDDLKPSFSSARSMSGAMSVRNMTSDGALSVRNMTSDGGGKLAVNHRMSHRMSYSDMSQLKVVQELQKIEEAQNKESAKKKRQKEEAKKKKNNRKMHLFQSGKSMSKDENRPQAWVDTIQGKMVFGFVIILNAICMGLEADHRRGDDETFELGWFLGECVFQAAFILELALRLKAVWVQGDFITTLREFCADRWNLVDVSLIISGAIQLSSQTTSFVGVFRLVRLVRLIRIIRYFRELWLLVAGILGALRALIWSVGLLLMILYVCGIACTKLIGHHEQLTAENEEKIRRWFGSVDRSIFTLFQIVSLEDWEDIIRIVFEEFPVSWLFFIPFIVLTNWTILNIVTAIVVETVLTISEREQMLEIKKKEKQRTENVMNLKRLFAEMDDDDNGELSIEEFNTALQDPKVVTQFQRLEISKYEAVDLFDLLDIDYDGAINAAEFIEGCLRVQGEAKSKHLLAMHYDLQKCWGDLYDVCNVILEEFQNLLERKADRLGVRVAGQRTSITSTEPPSPLNQSSDPVPPFPIRIAVNEYQEQAQPVGTHNLDLAESGSFHSNSSRGHTDTKRASASSISHIKDDQKVAASNDGHRGSVASAQEVDRMCVVGGNSPEDEDVRSEIHQDEDVVPFSQESITNSQTKEPRPDRPNTIPSLMSEDIHEAMAKTRSDASSVGVAKKPMTRHSIDIVPRGNNRRSLRSSVFSELRDTDHDSGPKRSSLLLPEKQGKEGRSGPKRSSLLLQEKQGKEGLSGPKRSSLRKRSSLHEALSNASTRRESKERRSLSESPSSQKEISSLYNSRIEELGDTLEIIASGQKDFADKMSTSFELVSKHIGDLKRALLTA